MKMFKDGWEQQCLGKFNRRCSALPMPYHLMPGHYWLPNFVQMGLPRIFEIYITLGTESGLKLSQNILRPMYLNLSHKIIMNYQMKYLNLPCNWFWGSKTEVTNWRLSIGDAPPNVHFFAIGSCFPLPLYFTRIGVDHQMIRDTRGHP